MYLTIYDSNLTVLGAVDVFGTVIWVRRDTEYGSFEITAPATKNNLNLLDKYNIVKKGDDNEIGFINSIQITNDLEKGEVIKATGLFYCGVLKQRCVLTNATNLKSLIENNLRELNLISVDSSAANITFANNFVGENLGECITALAKANGFGFKTLLDKSTGKINFSIYYGTDRSILQTVNPYVIFSDNYENLLESEYINSDTGVVNTVYARCKLPTGIESCVPPTYDITTGTGTGKFEKYIEVDAVTYDVDVLVSAPVRDTVDTTGYFKVTSENSMSVSLAAGTCHLTGIDFNLAYATSMTIDSADETQSRVDTVIIRETLATLDVDTMVIKGTLGGSATSPVRDGTYYDVICAEITVAPGTTVITNTMINNVYTGSGEEPSDGGNTITKTYLDSEATLAEMTAAAKAELVEIQENFQGAVGFKLKYRTEYDLGDIVTARNDKWGKVISQRITEVTEVYDNTSNAITPTFGNPARTILDILKKVK